MEVKPKHRVNVLIKMVTLYGCVFLSGLFYSCGLYAQNEFFYDEANQLTKVTDSSGTLIEYIYDDVGNILEIKRTTLRELAIIDISPTKAAIGTSVTLRGRGFSPTPADNTVIFNGVTAEVTSATDTALDVIIPQEATSGPVVITVGDNSFTSDEDFTVVQLPAINAINPRFALSGTTISEMQVTGENLTFVDFDFQPALIPPVLFVDSVSISPDGNSATLGIGVSSDAEGDFVLVASNEAGSSATAPSAANTFTVLGDAAADADGDGLTNGEEIALGMDPTNPDSDGDGLPDGFEVALGFDPLDPADALLDSDNDGISNLDEFNAGTDPFNPDITPPVVAQISPEAGSTDHPTNGAIVVRFAEPLKSESVTEGVVRLLVNSVELPGTNALSGDGLSITFMPNNVLTAFTEHQVLVQGVRDLAGNQLVGIFESSFTTSDFVDNVRPTVTATSIGGLSDVPINAPFTVLFSERMDPASLNIDTFIVRDNTTSENVPGMVQVDPSGLSASFVPKQTYPVARNFRVFLTTGIQDIAGNTLSFNAGLGFNTAFDEDLTAPQVTGVSPADQLSEVPTNARIMVEFDEPVQLLSVDQVNVSEGAGAVSVSRSLSNGNRTLTLVPQQQLAASSLHNVTIDGVLDLAGNPLAAISTSFTTDIDADIVRPAVAAVSPKNGTTAVPINVVAQVQFSERINPLTVTDTTVGLIQVNGTIRIASSISVSDDGRSVSLLPEQPLVPFTAYWLNMSGVQDLSGNNISSSFIRFTTGEGTDTTAPVVTALSLEDGVVDVPVNAPLVVQLDEVVSQHCVSGSTLQLSAGGSQVQGNTSLSSDGRFLTFDPDTNLSASTEYMLEIVGLCDLAGNELGSFSSSFTTSSSTTPDTTSPTVTFSPAFNDIDIDVNTTIVATFSERIAATSVSDSSFRVTTSGITVAGEFGINANEVIFTPLNPLPGGQVISVSLSGISDLAGNTASGSTRFTTTATQDVTSPEVVSVTPMEGAVNIGVTTPVVLNISESLATNTITATNFTLFANGERLTTSSPTRSADNLTLSWSLTLPAESVIEVVATDGATDLAGNPLVAFNSSFTTGAGLDSVGAQVVSQRPGSGARDVGINTSIVLYTDEALDSTTVEGALNIAQNGVLLNGTTSVTGNGRTIEFTPDEAWEHDALIQVFLDESAQDLAGNALRNYQGSFQTEVDRRLTPPTVVATSLDFVAVNSVPLNPVIQASFTEALAPLTVNETTVSLQQRNFGNACTNEALATSVILSEDGRTLEVIPDSPLLANTYYELCIESGVQDLDGDNLQFQYFRGFTTGDADDGLAPVMLGIAPPDGAVNVGVNANVHLRFDEPVNVLTITDQTVRLSDGTGTEMACTINFSDSVRDIVIVPHGPLNTDTQYSLAVEGVTDIAGNMVGPQFTSFTTQNEPDTTRPTVLRTQPVNGSTDVPVNAVVTLEVDEPIDPGTVNSTSFWVRDNTTSTNVAGSYSVSPNGRLLTFTPDVPFRVGRSHSVFFNTGITDVSGNSLNSSNFSFTTSFDEDVTAPQVAGVSPEDLLVDVPTNARIMVEFDEPVQLLSVDSVNVSDGAGAVNVARSLSNGNRTLALVPQQLLAASTHHTITIDGVLDLAGNPLAAVSTTFTTDTGVDLVRPTVTAVSPLNGATAVPTNAVAQLQFSERINPLTVTESTLWLQRTSGRVRIASSIVVSADGRSISLTPEQPLAPLTAYQLVNTSGIQDLSGNTVFTSTLTNFTTGEDTDTIAPNVQQANLTDGVTEVPVNAPVIIQLDEPVDVTSVSLDTIQLIAGGVPVAGVVSVSSDGQTLTFTPDVLLDPSTEYTVVVSGLVDLAGNPVTDFNSTFTTSASATADTTRPTLDSVTPENNAADVPVTTTVQLQFSERVNPLSVTDATFFMDATNNSGVHVPASLAVAADGLTATLTPSAPLLTSTSYRARVSSGIQDLAGNSLSASSVASTFTTASGPADTTPPEIVMVTPADGSEVGGVSTQVVITFSESLASNTVNSSNFRLLANNSLLSTSVSRSSDNRVVTLSSFLPDNSVINVVVTDGVTDLSGNPLADFASSFTTAVDEPDTSRPGVVSQRPGNGANNVGLDKGVILYTDQPLNPATVPGALHVSVDGVVVSGTTAVSGNDRVIEFTPDVVWQPGSLVQVFLDESAQDGAGNALFNYLGSFRVQEDTSTTPPTVLRDTFSSQSASAVPLNPVLEVEYNEPLDPASVDTTNVTLREGFCSSAPVSGTVSLVQGDKVIRFVPDAPLSPLTTYRYCVENSIQDLDGESPSFLFSRFFTTGEQEDATQPMVLSVAPPDGVDEVGVNAVVRVRFNEPVNPLSVTEETIVVSDGSNTAMACSISFSNSNRDVLLTPHGALTASTLHTFTVDGVTDFAGNLVIPLATSFTTLAEPDTVRPTVLRTQPVNSSTEVPVNAVVTLEVDEPVDPGTVNSTTFRVRDNTTSTDVTGSYSVSPDGRLLTFTPDVPFGGGRSHTVSYNWGITDLAGNALQSSNFSFTTSFDEDLVAPQVAGVSPADQRTEVPTNARVMVEFDEPVQLLSIDQVSVSGGTGAVNVSRSLSNGNRTLTLVPQQLLAGSTLYTVDIDGVLDLAGNPLAAVTTTFTTETGVDLVRPTVTAVSPLNGATAVPTDAVAQVQFSERLNLLTVTSNTLWLERSSGSVRISSTFEVSADGRSISLIPDQQLAPLTSYRLISSPSSIQDLSGNTLSASSWLSSFTTGN